MNTPDEHKEQLLKEIDKLRAEVEQCRNVEQLNLALASECERLKEREAAAAERSAFLAHASTVLASSLDYPTTLSTVARLTVASLADFCIVDLLEDAQTVNRMVIAHADPKQVESAWEVERRYPFDPTAPYGPARVVRSGAPEIVPAIDKWLMAAFARDHDNLKLLQALDLRSYMCVPLIASSGTFGALTFVIAGRDCCYGTEDLALAQALAIRAAQAIENARLHKAQMQARAEAEAANRTKDEFLATLSHELRTPLNSIVGYSQLLQRGGLTAGLRARALEAIERNGKLQTQLVDNLLDVSYMLRDQITLRLVPLDPARLVQNVVASLRDSADSKQISLQSELSAAGPLLGDPMRLRQIVWHLLSNAIKFTPQGGEVRVVLAAEEGGLRLQVEDNGVGIAAETLPHIFDVFRQADSTRTRRHGGLGLGLTLVKHLVKLHGGRVEAHSAGPGRGTCITVYLPMSRSLASKTVRLSSPAQTTEVLPLGGLQVLVIESKAVRRQSLSDALRARGAEVRAVASLAEAVQVLARCRPDVLVSDVGGSGQDSRYALVCRIGEHEQFLDSAEDERRILMANFEIRTTEPIKPREVTSAIARLVGRTRVARPASSLFPLDGTGRLGSNVEHNPVDAAHLVDDPVRDRLQ